jgi:hypothetical protein
MSRAAKDLESSLFCRLLPVVRARPGIVRRGPRLLTSNGFFSILMSPA